MKKLAAIFALFLAFAGVQAQTIMPTPKVKVLEMSYQNYLVLESRLPVIVKTSFSDKEIVFDEYKKPLFGKIRLVNYFLCSEGDKCIVYRYTYKDKRK